ncbi:DNA-processing protein DprA [Variovorax sp. HJSM1_2]|uniref:DNA-processing protein DprA n=1 Tax=Variovorax sp. HJSM1_2 TaxID=3366263 RepID=UPI003BE6075B
MQHDDLAAWLRLSLTPGIGNTAARRLLAAFGLPQAVFNQSSDALRQVVSGPLAEALLKIPTEWPALLESTWQWLRPADANTSAHTPRSIVTLGDADYPASLLAMEDPPLMLYLLGRIDLWQQGTFSALAMVGSRNPTPQGETNARILAHGCAAAGLTVVSGLALGIDTAAHEGALDGAAASTDQLATVAFVGTGLDRVYPKRNLALAHRIASQGLLVSEYPLGTPPLPGNFPKRNRLIAGLSQGTLVVEAALKSGSLITARLASEQGKEVFAVPGSIHAPQARGCHALLKQGAKLVETVQDVLEELRPLLAAKLLTPKNEALSAGTESVSGTFDDKDEANSDDLVLQQMGYDPVSLDALQARTGLPTAALQAKLLELELDDQVARLPGGLFQRQGLA